MPVPLLDIHRQHKPLESEFKAAFDRILKSGGFILGEEVAAFERAMAEYIGVEHAIGISSGTDALLVALMALDIQPGDEVLCPAFTFFGTAGSIVRLGAVPVWVDVDADSFLMDLEDAATKVGPRTKAVMPVHLFGQAGDFDEMRQFADRHLLAIIDDAAQAIGAKFKDRMVGAEGTIGAFSFYPTKNLGGLGDGGLMTTNDGELAEKIVRLRNHGMHPRYHHSLVGGNFRLDALQAALLRVKLPHLEAYHSARAKNAAYYLEELKGHGGIVLPTLLANRRHVWNQFTLRVREGRRDELRAFLAESGIGSEIYYPIALDKQECFRGVGRGAETLTNSHKLAAEVLSIPVFPELTEKERSTVAETLWKFGYA
jgi:dTDP-4-amino-4,6-dideoxygalactose transaminase